MKFARFFTLSLLLLLGVSAWAQDDDKPNTFKKPSETYNPDTTRQFKAFKPKKKFDISKLLIEPNIQLYFSGDYYQFGLMPSIGYNVWKNLYVGGSINYNLVYEPHVDPGTNTSPSVSLQVYGGGPFVHYRIWKGFFARVRTEVLAVRYPNYNLGYNSIEYATRGIPYLWFGAGYNLTASKNFFIPIAIYVNPLYPTYDGTVRTWSPYTSAIYFQVAFYIFSPHLL